MQAKNRAGACAWGPVPEWLGYVGLHNKPLGSCQKSPCRKRHTANSSLTISSRSFSSSFSFFPQEIVSASSNSRNSCHLRMLSFNTLSLVLTALASATVSGASSPPKGARFYSVTDTYIGPSFLTGFDHQTFGTDIDPTHGRVKFVRFFFRSFTWR